MPNRFRDEDEPLDDAGDADFATRALEYLDGSLDGEQRAKFLAELQADDALRQEFVAICVQSGQMSEALGQVESPVDMKQDLRPTLAAKAVSLWRGGRARVRAAAIYLSRPASLSLLIAAVSVSLLIGILAWRSVPPAAPRPVAQRAPREAQFVARLVWMKDTAWATTQEAPQDGSLLRAGERLELAAGTATVIFDTGVQMLLQGPTKLALESSDVVELEAGRVSCLVPLPAAGFAVRTPQCSIIDLGTEFGVDSQPTGGSQVHVFQGEVRVEASSSENGRVVKAGEAIRIGNSTHGKITSTPPIAEQFVRPTASAAAGDVDKTVISANFDSSVFGSAGWLSAWNMQGDGEVYRDVRNPLSGPGNAYLQVALRNANDHTMRRTYGKHGEIDPAKPHVIRWKWRFDGDAKQLTNFNDRVHFFGDTQAIAGSTSSNSWLIGLVFGVQDDRVPIVGRWYFFDSQRTGKHDSHHHKRNMVDTGMELVPGAVYVFEVFVSPAAGTYDATISDGQQRFAAKDLHFRSGTPGTYPVLHFGGCASAAGEDHTFALDSIEIRPMTASQEKDAPD